MKFLFTFLISLIVCNLSAQVSETAKISDQHLEDSVLRKVEIEAKFPGGDDQWNQYVKQEIEKHIDKLSRNKKSNGTCEIQFIVDKDGSITNVEALSLKNSLLAKILINAIKEGPKWIPAFQHGKVVKAWRRQKVTFLLPN